MGKKSKEMMMLRCPHCQAKMIEHSHTLNPSLAIALKKLIMHKKPAALSELDLTNNQYTNFQKLKYWGFVKNENGKWTALDRAIEFFMNSPVPKYVYTYRGEVKRTSEETMESLNVF